MMPSFLQDLGAFGSGLAPQIDNIAQLLRQNQTAGDVGNALAAQYGGVPSGAQQQPQSALGGLLSSLGGSFQGPQMQAPQASVAPSVASTPSVTSQNQAPLLPVPQANVQPPTAQAGVSPLGGGSQPPQAAPQAPPQAAPPPQSQSLSQAQPQARAQPQAQSQMGQGPLDLPTLVQNLVKQGVTGARLGRAVDHFIPLLNAQGLQQYRDLGLQLRREGLTSLEENRKDLQRERQFQDNPNAPGSRAQSRVANQSIAVQRLQDLNNRFDERFQEKKREFDAATTDKEKKSAKADLENVVKNTRAQIQVELNIINSPGTLPEDQAAAKEKINALNKKLDGAVKAVEEGSKGGDSGGSDSRPTVAKTADGKVLRWNGKEPYGDITNWQPDGGQ